MPKMRVTALVVSRKRWLQQIIAKISRIIHPYLLAFAAKDSHIWLSNSGLRRPNPCAAPALIQIKISRIGRMIQARRTTDLVLGVANAQMKKYWPSLWALVEGPCRLSAEGCRFAGPWPLFTCPYEWIACMADWAIGFALGLWLPLGSRATDQSCVNDVNLVSHRGVHIVQGFSYFDECVPLDGRQTKLYCSF